jgi:P-type Ca2+ transporter type 2C
MSVTTGTARRDGRVVCLDAAELVPGDVIVVAAGDRLPADGRLLASVSLEVAESALSGESQAVVKSADAVVDGNASLGDRTTVLLINTAVTRGRGEAVVTATGMATETGRIAELLHQAKPDPTRLRHQIDATINTTAFSLDVAPLSSTVANATSWYRTACGSLPWAARSTGCQLVQ